MKKLKNGLSILIIGIGLLATVPVMAQSSDSTKITGITWIAKER